MSNDQCDIIDDATATNGKLAQTLGTDDSDDDSDDDDDDDNDSNSDDNDNDRILEIMVMMTTIILTPALSKQIM
ncbi:hypothetical protein PoB_001309300 [Plakobranchus ocellatus]|uniref:Uncharacterized protein n=1 Tax=Plakobranchus ocellatus TaxID=259542 RepID=A0AAV3YWH7_9GAST|nr:hypothetical protein PoB_001309300 [Plakobranchus ocellatus]